MALQEDFCDIFVRVQKVRIEDNEENDDDRQAGEDDSLIVASWFKALGSK
jgi:hypothetical protein